MPSVSSSVTPSIPIGPGDLDESPCGDTSIGFSMSGVFVVGVFVVGLSIPFAIRLPSEFDDVPAEIATRTAMAIAAIEAATATNRPERDRVA